MGIIEAIEGRRARRAIADRSIDRAMLERAATAGTLAPSCYNNQPWLISIAQGAALDGLKAQLPEGNAWAKRAPAIMAVSVRECDDCRLDDGRDYALFDAGLCAMNIITQASSEGLIAHPIAGYQPKKAKAALGLGADRVLIALIILGWPGGPEDEASLSEWQKRAEHGPRERKDPSETIRWSE